jgi:hypothetical protein
MAILPTGYVVGTRGVHNVVPTEEIGATIMGVTSATSTGGRNPVTQALQLNDALHDNRLEFSGPVEASGTLHTFSATKAYSAGTFAYDQSEFLIRGVADTINGVANTSLLINGNAQHRLRRHLKQKAWGYKYSTAIRAGYFQVTGVANQRTNWSTAPSALNATFKSTTNNSTDSSDEGQYVTYKSVPGELTYMDGGRNPFTDEYAARTL